MTDTHRPEQDSEPTPNSPLTSPSTSAEAPLGETTALPGSEAPAPDAQAASVEQAADRPLDDSLSSPAPQPSEASKDQSNQEHRPEAVESAPSEANGTPGEDSPEAEVLAQDFPSLGLPESLLAAIAKLGWDKPSPVQAKSFEPFVSGRDVLVQSHTGSGKTGAFCLPWIAKQNRDEAREEKKGTVRFLAVVPTRELAKQVAKEFCSLADGQDLRIESFYGGTAIVPQLSALEKGVDVVIGTPGRLLDLLRRKSLKLSKLETVVLDECDEMLSMGFLEDIRAILDHCPKERQTGLFSATLPPDILRISGRYLENPIKVELSGDQIAAREIDHVYYNVTNSVKTRDLLDVLMVEDPPTGIIFCNTREETRMVASVLQREGYSAEAISSDLTQAAREEVLAGMREHRIRFLVATDIAARGIDISHITHVINYSFPNVAESYVHRTGRTGRAGKSGVAISLISPLEIGDFYLLKKQYADLNISERLLPEAKVLQDQRREVKVDRISRELSVPVSPEWIALARDLQKDPRGERIVAYLLYRATKESKAKRARPAQEERVEEGESSRDSLRSREREDRGRGRSRDRDRDREAPRRSRESREEGEDKEQGSARADGRVSRRDRVAKARREGRFGEGRQGRSRRSRGEDRPEETQLAEQPVLDGDLQETEQGQEEPSSRSLSSRRGSTRERNSQAPGEAPGAERTQTEPSLDLGPDLQEGAEDEQRRRRRRRRRTRGRERKEGEGATASQEAAQDSASEEESGTRRESGRGRNRNRRRGRSRPSSENRDRVHEARVAQDQIIIDIDEEELEVVRDTFGEINELDDLTVKGRRRGFLDELESSDEVVLEDLSIEDQARAPKESEEFEEEAEDTAPCDAAQDEEEAEVSKDEESEDEAAADQSGQSEGEEAPRKKRRRRRRKKRQPPPMPELTAPPHKDFWEVWSESYSASDFKALEEEDQAQTVAEEEQKALARAQRAEKRAQEREAAAQARKERREARAAQREQAQREVPEEAKPSVEKPTAASAEGEEEIFTRIALNIGRSQGCKSATIRKLMEERCGLGRRNIRDLTVRSASTLLQVEQSQLDSVCSALNGHEFGECVIEVRLADELHTPSASAPAEREEEQVESAAPDPTQAQDASHEKAAAMLGDDSSPPEGEAQDSEDSSEELEATATAKKKRSRKKSAKKRGKKKATKKKSTKKASKKKTTKKKSTKKASKKKTTKKKSTKKASKKSTKKSSSKSG